MSSETDDRVSRRRYEREQRAREEAEALLEQKSRELFLANKQLSEYSTTLEGAVLDRTAKLRSALEKAEAASTMRSRFVATMSHEIRTPLGGLLGMIDLLATDETDASKLELLKYAKTSGEALNRIVNDVLDFSKMDAGVFVFEEESVDLRALVESVIALARTNRKCEDRSIFAKVDSTVPKLFFGDATRIRQIISNFVSNALRYSVEGPIIVRAKATPDPKGVLLRVEVEDFGIGIEPDQIGNLFKDFSQISTSLTAAAQGTGLGLAISKRIVEGCGGQIGVDSTPAVGSTFWFELPVEVLAAPQALELDAQTDAQDSSGVSLVGKRVLLAEDNVINQKLLLTYLKRMEVDADLAENGRVALEKFEPGKYDLVLMDVAMPEIDGLDAIRQIRTKWTEDVLPPILILTAHVMDAIQDEAASVGVETVLSKPIPYDELKLAMQSAVGAMKNDVPVPPEPPVIPKNESPDVFALMSADAVQQLLETFSPEDLTDLVKRYVIDAQSIVADMRVLYENNSHKQLSAQAHSLKGSSLLLGFSRIAELAGEVEMRAEHIDATMMADMTDEISNILVNLMGKCD
ncbi:ATP-binding protein [Yoonia maritima]|uniref:ATP-binding protein n=1 Tax=Yoonia maritima TaxID=1435347 RepID=UPI000D101588|nr:ATP-binding protein [Yoonia maritima]